MNRLPVATRLIGVGAVLLAVSPALAQQVDPPPGTPGEQGADAGAAPEPSPSLPPPEAAAPAVSTGAPGTAPRGVSVAWVTRTLIANNPELRTSLLATQQGRQRVAAEEGRYPYTLEADAGYTHSQVPSLGGTNAVTISTRDSFTVGSELRRTFPTGTQAAVRVEGERFRSSRPTTGALFSNQAGVGYQATARASVTQPLLRGAGRKVNESELRAARLSQAQSELAYRSQLSALVHDALQAYWELWYAARATEIEQAALELAEVQHRDALARQELGALAPVDTLQFRTRIAELQEAVVAAHYKETAQTLKLAELLGQPAPRAAWRAVAAMPPSPSALDPSRVLASAIRSAPAVAEREARVKLARERAETAGDEYRARLDLQGWVEAAGLGAQRPNPALRQVAGLDAVSVFGGVVFETPLDARRRDAVRAQAQLDVHIAEQELTTTRHQLQSQAAQLLADVERANAGLRAAEATVGIAESQVQLERQRFKLGGSTVLQVQQAEEALRQSRQRVARAQVDRAAATIAIWHVTGTLLERVATR